MKPNLIFVFCMAAALLSGCAKKEQPHSKNQHEKIDSIFAAVGDFSGVVLVGEKGKPVYHKAFGYLNFETKELLDTTSIFELASVSKQFTAMLIMMLKEEGKLQYDDAIEKYLPGIPYTGITIRHLLTHTSGLPDYQAIMDTHWDKSKVAGNPEILAYLIKYHPPKNFEPGEKYQYSNTGYVLLGSIAEKASGKDFIEFIRERILRPLRMASTDIRTNAEKMTLQNFAVGHIYVQEKQRYVRADSFPSSNYTIWLGNRKGPGRISSTAADLLKWDRGQYTENLVKKSTWEEGIAPYRLKNDSLSNYGFGLELQDSKIGKVVRHSGDNPGYNTHIIRYIEADKTVILLCNNQHKRFNEVLKAIERLVESETGSIN